MPHSNSLSPTSPTAALLNFVQDLQFDDIPAAVVAEAKRNILDFLGVSIGGAQHQAAELMLAQVQELGGNEQSTIPVSGYRTSVTNTALVLGVMGHVLDFDDTHMPTILHGTTPVMSAVLPIAEWQGATGRDVLVAYIVGFEAATRLALALHPSHYNAGWHVTATAGTIGAALASSRLLRTEPSRWRHSAGLAATQAAGHREHFGTMAKSFGVGKAAANGVLAAVLAHRGYEAAPEALAGRRGMLAVMGNTDHPERLAAGLGDEWELLHSGLKPYPCGVVTHPAIDLALQLKKEHRVDDIVGIDTQVHPLVLELTNKPEPNSELEGKFSVTFAMAVALSEGELLPHHFAGDGLNQQQIAQLRQSIALVPDDSLTEAQARATVQLADGRTITSAIDIATGMPGNRLSDNAVSRKFHGLVDPVLGAQAADRIEESVSLLAEVDSLIPLLAETIRD